MTGSTIAKRCVLAAALSMAFAVAAHASEKPPMRVHKLDRKSQQIERKSEGMELVKAPHPRDWIWRCRGQAARKRTNLIASRKNRLDDVRCRHQDEHLNAPPIAIGVDRLSFQAGAAVVGDDACWQCVQPSRGTWDWSYDDALHAELGSRWLPILDYAPAWAGGGTVNVCPFLARVPPTDIRAYAAFARAFVARYHPAAVEVWNEPDIYVFMDTPHPGPVYRQMYLAAYAAIKSVRPSTKVLLAGEDETNGGWFMPSLAGVPADGVSAHAYAATPAGVAELAHTDERQLARLRINAPLYLTEVGISGRYCTTPHLFLQIVAALIVDPDVRQIDASFCGPPGVYPPGFWGIGCPTVKSSAAGVRINAKGRLARRRVGAGATVNAERKLAVETIQSRERRFDRRHAD